jgi:hypothetical protein
LTAGPKNAADRDEWVAFVGNAVGGLREAAALLQTRKAEFEAKRDWFRPRMSGIPRENSVSRALAELFGLLRSEQAISGSGVQAIDLRHISIECERPRPRDPGISDESKPTDFSLVLLKDNELDLRIEAKTILSDAEIRKHYLGEQGLRRFDDSTNPYTLQPFGGMVAYVVDSDAKTWMAKIGAEMATAVGASRLGTIKVGPDDHHVSRHQIKLKAGANNIRHDVDVVHFAIEIDAKPPKR